LGEIKFNLVQTINYTWLGKPVVMPRITHTMSPINPGGGVGGLFYFKMGGDNISYLGFGTIDPRISLKRESGMFKPVFNITLELFVVHNLADYNPFILPDDYNLSIQLWKGPVGTGENKDNISINLDQNAFIRMGKTCPGVGCILLQGSIFYNFDIPMKNEYLADFAAGTPYKVAVFSVKKTEPFKDLKIARTAQYPYFRPGDIAYQLDNTLYFWGNSRIDNEKIILFNPSFYKTQISLNLTAWSDKENFTISFDGVNFQKNIFKTFELQPLQDYDATFYVNATYEPWISYNKLEHVNFTIKAVINSTSSLENVINQLTFYLNVSNQNSPAWLNLYTTDYSPRFIFLPDIGKSTKRNVFVNWSIDGNDLGFSAYSGRGYVVNVSLIDADTKVILQEFSGNYAITPGVRKETLVFNHDFAVGDYMLNVTLDIGNAIAETDSSGSFSENDNNRLYSDLRVRGCFYNLTDNSVYYLDWFDIPSKDDCSRCMCPYGLICQNGLGVCSSPDGICNYADPYACNDFAYHLSVSNNDACGWECGNGPCPPTTNIFSGVCKNCSAIKPDACMAYNNNLTCEADPCYKARDFECPGKPGCELDEDYYCYWNYNSNNCEFYYKNSSGDKCNFTERIVQECNEGSAIGIVEYTGIPASCGNFRGEYTCSNVIKLNFFNFFNLVAAIIMIGIVYCRFLIKKLSITNNASIQPLRLQ
jgi:hypothetical protein